MPSSMRNLSRTLTWNDFPRVQRPVPSPGQFVEAAETAADIVPAGFGLESAPGGGGVRIRDSITVTIEFRRHQSWVANWVFTRPPSFQTALLAHEQGHYNIAALFGRDFFLALMRLKANTYPDAAGAQADLNAAQTDIAAKAQPAQDRYDVDTQNGTNATQQARWNGFINAAFTQPANPLEQAADGTPIKITLLKVLAQAGINL